METFVATTPPTGHGRRTEEVVCIGRSRFGLVGAVLCTLVVLAGCTAAGDKQPPDLDTPPGTPTGLMAAAGDGEVSLVWNANPEPDLRGYQVYWGLAGGTLDQSAFVAAPTATHTVTGLTNGQPYAFALEAEDDAGRRSARSDQALAVPVAVDEDDEDDEEENGAGEDHTPPTVVASVPADADVDVARNASIAITFSEPMDEALTEAAWSVEPSIGCDFDWRGASTILVCEPSPELAPDTVHTVTLGAGAADLAGNALAAPFTFTFTTGARALQVCLFDDPASLFGACLFAP